MLAHTRSVKFWLQQGPLILYVLSLFLANLIKLVLMILSRVNGLIS